jgi:hypothetical protein
MECYELLQVHASQAFIRLPLTLVAIGKVWWWAQNWSQSRAIEGVVAGTVSGCVSVRFAALFKPDLFVI